MRAPRGSAGRPAPWSTAILLGLTVLLPAAPGAAQDPTPPPPPPTPDLALSAPAPAGPSPRGAFLRSLVVPGWGHAAIGAYGRGAFYVATESATAWGLIRTRLRLAEARERAATRERVLRTALETEGVTDPAELQARIGSDPDLAEARGLVIARESQQEDWVALGIFLMLLSGADAYISAHLANFPDPIDVGIVPGPDGRVELAVRVPVPGP